MPLEHNQKTIPLRLFCVGQKDMLEIYRKLNALVQEQADIELNAMVKNEGETDEGFEQRKVQIRRDVFRTTVTIQCSDGASFFDSTEAIFEDLPDNIVYVYVTNVTAYQGVTQRDPWHMFRLGLDFKKPSLMDWQSILSAPTNNESYLEVRGDRTAWTSGVNDAVLSIIEKRRTHRAFLHRAFSYDVGLMFVIPAALNACWRAGPVIESLFGHLHTIVAAGAYIYVTWLVLWCYRTLFGYAKWVFPTAELKGSDQNPKAHRKLLYFLATSAVSPFVLQLVYWLFSFGQ